MTALTQAEQSFVEAVARGAVWSPDYYKQWLERQSAARPPAPPGPAQPRPGEPAAAPAPAPTEPPSDIERPMVRAHIIRALIEDSSDAPKGKETILAKGIQIAKAQITGALDLEAVVFDRPLTITETVFDQPLVLRDATLRAVTLDRSVIPHIDAANAHIRGHFRARRLGHTDFINLLSARVEGHLVLQGSHLNPREKPLQETGGTALQCNAAEFGASVFLRQGFRAQGCVSFVRARIAGQLACVGGRFINPDGLALYCNACVVGVDVFLDDGFEAQGEVNFTVAEIGGQLSCFGGRFENADGVALDANGARVGADVFLRDGFLAKGKVDLSRCEIAGSLQLRNDSRIEGDMDVRQSRAAVLMDEAECWPAPPYSVDLDGFVYERLGEGAPTGWKARAAWLTRARGPDGRPLFLPQPWSQAAQVLEVMGHDHDARMLRQKREKRRPAGGGLTGRLAKGLRALVTGYGYRPGLTLIWMILVVALSGLIYQGAGRDGAMAARAPQAAAVTPFKPWVYALDAFLPLVDLGQTEAWIPRAADGALLSAAAAVQGPPAPRARPDSAGRPPVEAPATNQPAPTVPSTEPAAPPVASAPVLRPGAGPSSAPAEALFWLLPILGWILVPLYVATLAGWLRRP